VGLFFALGWLLPNHQPPWSAFHHDAWCALASTIAAVPLLFRTKGPWAVPRAGLVLGLAVCIPLLQWGMGHIPLAGHAWMSIAYLSGVWGYSSVPPAGRHRRRVICWTACLLRWVLPLCCRSGFN